MCQFIPTKTTVKTPELVRLFNDNIYRLYGLPASTVSDRDQKLNSHFWQAVDKMVGDNAQHEYG